MRARVQRRLALDAFGQTKLLQQGGHGQLAAMHTGLVGVAEFDEKPLGLERDEFGHARLDRPDRYFVHPPGEPFSLVGKDSGEATSPGNVWGPVPALSVRAFADLN